MRTWKETSQKKEATPDKIYTHRINPIWQKTDNKRHKKGYACYWQSNIHGMVCRCLARINLINGWFFLLVLVRLRRCAVLIWFCAWLQRLWFNNRGNRFSRLSGLQLLNARSDSICMFSFREQFQIFLTTLNSITIIVEELHLREQNVPIIPHFVRGIRESGIIHWP